MQRRRGKTRSPGGNDKRTKNTGFFFAHTQAGSKAIAFALLPHTSWLKANALPLS